MSFLKKHGSLLMMSFFLGFLVPRIFGPSLQADVTGENPYLKSETWEDAVVNYNLKVDEIMNEYLSKLFEEEEPNVTFPEQGELCEADNVSTYCLGVVLSNELYNLEVYLSDQKNVLDKETDVAFEGQITLENAGQITAIKSDRIEYELQAAQDALDLSLAVYNQSQLVYPLHTELVQVQQNLEIYRDNLASIRDVIEGYPGKFHDATTIECK